MANISDSQLRETRRLASLLLAIVNKTDICISKLRDGFIEPTDMTETRKKIERQHAEIMQIDADADNALNGEGPAANSTGKAQEQTESSL